MSQVADSRPVEDAQDRPAPLLVVDDEESNRDMLSRRLKRAGYEVEVAGRGDDALRIIQDREIDLVLLDIMMPVMNGIELLKLLRATVSAEELPVIMVTAVNDSAQVVDALRHGANDYITKPIDFPVARARIESQLTRKRAEEALRDSEERLALATRGSNDGLWDWDLKTNRVHYSPRWKEMLGYSESEIEDNPEEWIERAHPDDRAGLEATLREHQNGVGESEFVSEHRLRHKDGSYRWLLARGVALHSEEGIATRMAGSLTDVTESKTFDSLTSLPNRTLFVERLAQAIQVQREETGDGYAALFIDLDHFKLVNDSLGHAIGDKLLVGVARRLESAVRIEKHGRGQDMVARFGGDEFAVLVDQLENPDLAKRVAQRILDGLRQPFDLDGKEVFSSATIGIAIGDADHQTPAEVLRDADTAMYRAKALGRGRYSVFDAEMRALATTRLELENDLRKALDGRELEVYYQPKIDLRTEKLCGFEALLRWNHLTRGIVSPVDFIPVAEETGLIGAIGAWTLREACFTMKKWNSRFGFDPPLEVSVNVSVRQFRQEDFVQLVRNVLKESGLPATSLQLEITESVLMEDREDSLAVLEELKQLGVGLKIDDFGTGYSSLRYLNEYPFDSLKIDRSFVFRLGEDTVASDVIETILLLAKNLGMEVIAEGVETQDQLARLKALGCRFGQGFYFSRPVREHVAEDLLAEAKLRS